ncbi:hypothetical protein WMY93_023986 [Mugilogobius chulae]|uniref:RING-type E3 ubiquitin transferase n=1 Tax=Mugilogobius chulae TaxID=88201 RepID=A0AAW0NAQ9_9GOBI
MGGKQSTTGRPRGTFPGCPRMTARSPFSPFWSLPAQWNNGPTQPLEGRTLSEPEGVCHNSPHGTGYQDTGGGGHHTDGVLYLGSRGSLADTLPLHITPRWFSAHSELQQGDTIARLPCLCIYHKRTRGGATISYLSRRIHHCHTIITSSCRLNQKQTRAQKPSCITSDSKESVVSSRHVPS